MPSKQKGEGRNTEYMYVSSLRNVRCFVLHSSDNSNRAPLRGCSTPGYTLFRFAVTLVWAEIGVLREGTGRRATMCCHTRESVRLAHIF